MRPQLLVSDAGPLIALARIEQLKLLPQLFDDVVMTESVRQEVLPPQDFAEKKAIQSAITAGWLKVVNDETDMPEMSATTGYTDGLDPGETSSILYTAACQKTGKSAIALLDEAKGRAVARRLSLNIIGTVGVIGLAKQTGLIIEARPLLEQLQESGYFLSDSLIRHGLRLAGEA